MDWRRDLLLLAAPDVEAEAGDAMRKRLARHVKLPPTTVGAPDQIP